MVRPLVGENLKKHVTITIDPDAWKSFQDIVKEKEPDGDKSASAHLETLIRRENARIVGLNMPDAVNTERLSTRLINLRQRHEEMLKRLRKRDDKPLDKFDELAHAYNLDMENYTNASEVASKVLADWEDPDSKVREIFGDLLPESDLSLFVTIIELATDIIQTNKKLLEAFRTKYNVPKKEQPAAATQTQNQLIH
jgi:hypothetical protein